MTPRRNGPHAGLNDLASPDVIVNAKGETVRLAEINRLDDGALRKLTRQMNSIVKHATGDRQVKARRWSGALHAELRKRQLHPDEPRRERPIAERMADAREALYGTQKPSTVALADSAASDATLTARTADARAALGGIGADDPQTAERTRLARQALYGTGR